MKKYLLAFLAIASIMMGCKDSEPVANTDPRILQSINIGIDGVIDFTSDGQNFYLLTKDKIYFLNRNGKVIKEENCSDITGIYYSEQLQKIVKISTHYKIFSDSQDTINFKIYDISYPPAYVRYLTRSDSCYITCVFMGGIINLTYSDFIGNLWENEYAEINEFFSGVPGGLFYKSKKLYYVSNDDFINPMNMNDIVSYVDIIDLSTNETRLFEIPVNSAIGIYKDNQDNYYTYSRATKRIVKFKE